MINLIGVLNSLFETYILVHTYFQVSFIVIAAFIIDIRLEVYIITIIMLMD